MNRIVPLIFAAFYLMSIGCSKGDKNNITNRPDLKAAEAAQTQIYSLTVDDKDLMTFSIVNGDTASQSLKGTVRSSSMTKNALASDDAAIKADVMTLNGKDFVYVVVHDGQEVGFSSMFLFTLEEANYSLKISNIKIETSGSLDQIYTALQININAGLSLDKAILHMINAFNENVEMTFQGYMKALESKYSVVVEPITNAPPTASGSAGVPECREDCDSDSKIGSPNPPLPVARPGSKQPPIAAPIERPVVPAPAPRPAVVNPDAEPTPRMFPPAIKPKITKQSAPQSSPRPVDRPIHKGTPYQAASCAGESVRIHCDNRKSSITVNNESRQLPEIDTCVSASSEDDTFKFGFTLENLNYLNFIKNMKFTVDVDLSKQHFVRNANFRANQKSAYDQATSPGQSRIAIHGDGVNFDSFEVTTDFVSTEVVNKDSVVLKLVCTVERSR